MLLKSLCFFAFIKSVAAIYSLHQCLNGDELGDFIVIGGVRQGYDWEYHPDTSNHVWSEDCAFTKVVWNHAWKLTKEDPTVQQTYNDNNKQYSNRAVRRARVMALIRWTHRNDIAFQDLNKRPPPSEPANTLVVHVNNIVLKGFYQAAWNNKIYAVGYLTTSWQDDRLKFGTETLDFATDKGYAFPIHGLRDSITLVNDNSIWSPHFWFDPNKENSDHDKAMFFPNGTVSMKMWFYVHGTCEMDYKNFPNDQHTCCIHLRSKSFTEVINYDVQQSTLQFHPNGHYPAWFKRISTSVEASSYGAYNAHNDDEIPSVKMCLTLQRYSTIYIYKIVLPIAACCFVAIVIPLFSSWKLQIASKLLAMMFVFLAMQSTSGYHAAFGPDVPKFVKVYDFLLWTTSISVTITIILWGLTFQKKFTSPPHQLSLASNIINPIFIWTNPAGENYVSFEGPSTVEEGGAQEPAKNIRDYSKDWSAIFLGFNNVHLVLITIIYLIGLIVCAA